jgi:hypothetical protein
MEEILKSIEALYRNQVIINEKLDALLKADIENINEKQQFKFDINMLNSKLDKVISKTSDIEVRLQVLDDINNKDPEMDEIKYQLNELKDQINQLSIYRDLY